MRRTVVLNVVGLTRALLRAGAPRLGELAGGSADLRTVLPAVTCSVQATYLTGKLPSEHGIVGNGWYFRDLNEVWFWRQSNRLVQAEQIWQTARRRDGSFTCANTFWWFNMATDVDWSVTPRPVYCADGRKLPDCYSSPPELRERFNREFGQFPLFQFWGPATSVASSDWIARAAVAVEENHQPTLQLVYLPHLDYVLQKVGPSGDISRDLREIDALCGRLLDFFRNRGVRVLVLSEYGITDVGRAIHPNRLLREAGLLAIKEDLGREYLDPGRSRAFAVADHQIAHVYVRRPADIQAVEELFRHSPGVEHVLGTEAKRAHGLGHERSGEVVLVAERDAWFTYYHWRHDATAPDYARTVNIHAKPGYDPCELFLDPKIRFPKAKIGWTLLKKVLGFRYLLDVVPLDASLVRGSHGRITESAEEGPILLTTEPKFLVGNEVGATEVCPLILDHVFRD
ncbi:MAG: alkaline phosphatase family protein [Deltaproteobacteria bacterium]|nr:alkaline phosphatase family protein [Deltaproteobacteria bacterium]